MHFLWCAAEYFYYTRVRLIHLSLALCSPTYFVIFSCLRGAIYEPVPPVTSSSFPCVVLSYIFVIFSYLRGAIYEPVPLVNSNSVPCDCYCLRAQVLDQHARDRRVDGRAEPAAHARRHVRIHGACVCMCMCMYVCVCMYEYMVRAFRVHGACISSTWCVHFENFVHCIVLPMHTRRSS